MIALFFFFFLLVVLEALSVSKRVKKRVCGGESFGRSVEKNG